jgi:hypothetical protein
VPSGRSTHSQLSLFSLDSVLIVNKKFVKPYIHSLRRGSVWILI